MSFFSSKNKTTYNHVPTYAKAGFESLGGLIPGLATQGQTETGKIATNQLNATLGGDYLYGESNPYLASMADAIRRQFDSAVGSGMQRVGQQMTLGGTPYSSKTGVLGGRVVRQSGQDLADRLASLYGGAYENERSRMTGLIPMGLQEGQNPLNQAITIASLMKGAAGTSKNVDGLNNLMTMHRTFNPLGAKLAGG